MPATSFTVPSEFETCVAATSLMFAEAGERVQRLAVELSAIGQAHVVELGARPPGELLPRHQVRVVLHLGRDDRVAGAEELAAVPYATRFRPSVALRTKITSRRRAGVQERGDDVAGALVALGRHLTQRVDRPVHGGVGRLVDVDDRVDHRPRLLRGRRRVEVGGELPVHLAHEDREIELDASRVERRRRGFDRHGSQCRRAPSRAEPDGGGPRSVSEATADRASAQGRRPRAACSRTCRIRGRGDPPGQSTRSGRQAPVREVGAGKQGHYAPDPEHEDRVVNRVHLGGDANAVAVGEDHEGVRSRREERTTRQARSRRGSTSSGPRKPDRPMCQL